jgi:Fusaric acid resistance protein-like
LDRASAWLRAHDPNYGALRRACRAAIVMPSLFAFGDKVIANPGMAYFLAFGSFAMLLMVDFAGTLLDRVRAQTLLGLSCALLICVGTLVSRSTVLSVVGMFLVGFAVLFSGVVSSVIASATTPLLLSFILPVTVPGPNSQIPDRVAGWGMAALVSLFAITILWPAAVAYPVEGRAVDACRALAARIRAEIAWILGDGGEQSTATAEQARARADASIATLDKLFLATPYRPTGLSTKARAEIRLVDELRWLSGVVLRARPRARPAAAGQAVCDVKLAAAEVLDQAAAALAGGGSADALRSARDGLRDALRELETHTTSVPVGGPELKQTDGALAATVISALDPSFRAQELAYVTEQIGANAEFAAAASRRSWIERLLGRQPTGFTGAFASVRERALAHAEPSSSWLHNSLRGGSGLALAVLIADLTSVQHGFWVVFGALAVLRSNALSTGQNVLRGLLGTTVGFIVGGALVALVGTNTTLLWVILPIAVLCGGLAPSAISFAAGQAAFTLTLLVLFNLLVPEGWKLGLVRVEDVAIGGAVSLAVGLLFWPRGAGADLGRALGRAYIDSSSYLADAVAFGVACCDSSGPPAGPPRAQAVKAAASARRLDDTFRGFLTERGQKKVPLAEVTALVTGVAGVRLAADAVLDLWDGDGEAAIGNWQRAGARRELLDTAGGLSSWYDRFAASLAGAADVPEAMPVDADADSRLVDTVASDLRDGDGHASATGVRVIWTGDHLDAVRRLQESLVGPAKAAMAAANSLA